MSEAEKPTDKKLSENNTEEKGQASLGWLDAWILLSFLIPLLYTTGWSYAYHHFESYHLGLMGLDISKEFFFLYSYLAAKEQLFLFMVTLITLTGAVLFGANHYKKFTLAYNPAKVCRYFANLTFIILIPGVALLFLMIFYRIGEEAATSSYNYQVANDFDSYPRVAVWLKKETEAPLKDLSQELQKGCYRLLMRNKDNLFLFYPADQADKLPTEIIPSGEVAHIRILPHYHSCKDW